MSFHELLTQLKAFVTDQGAERGARGCAPRGRSAARRSFVADSCRWQSTITAPNPTNAFAPPPKVLDEQDASAGPAPRHSELPVVMGTGRSSVDGGAGGLRPGNSADDGGVGGVTALPSSTCVETCATKFRDCSAAPTCEKTYRACMRGCFK